MTEPTNDQPTASQPETLTGSHGTAERIPSANHADTPATLAAWIITSDHWHPAWDQYLLSVITLAPIPGAPPAQIDSPGATHELIVAALDPKHGPYDAATATTATLDLLRPVNIAQQFAATDDSQARQLAQQLAQTVIDGRLIPETADAPDQTRAAWARAAQQGVTVEEIDGGGDTERYILRAGEPGTGWAALGKGADAR